MEGEQDDFVERANDEGPANLAEETNNTKRKCAIAILVLILIVLFIFFGVMTSHLKDTKLWYANAFLAVFIIFFFALLLRLLFCTRSKRGVTSTVMPRGLHLVAAQGAPTATVRRFPETGQRRNIDPAHASTSSRVTFLDTAPGPSGLQNPVVVFSSGRSCRNLQPVQERTQSVSHERDPLSCPISEESSESPEMSDIASKKTTWRERIRTRSVTKQKLDEASTSAAGQPIDPSVPGPSHLHTPEFHGLSESSVRQLRSSKKKTETESRHSDLQSVLKSLVSEKSTIVTRGVRRREKFAARKGSVEKKLDSDDSVSADSELE